MTSPSRCEGAVTSFGSICLLGFGVIVAAGCGASSGWRDQVRQQASEDHRCPPRSIEIVRHTDDAKARRVTLEVCGRRRVYRESNTSKREGRATGPRWRMVKRRRRRRTRDKGRSRESGQRPVVRRSKQRRDPYTAAMHRTMGKAGPAFMACYRAAQRHRPSLKGAVVVRFVIDRRGRVEEAIPEVNQLTPGIGSCLVNRIRDLRFPCPPRGRATLHWPFTFEE